MSKALKCNRCKKCFDPNSLKDGEYIISFDNPVYFNRGDYQSGKFTGYLFEGKDREKVDLCPTCSEDYRLFMEGYNLAVHDNDFDRPDIPEKEEPESESEIVKWMRKHWDEIENEFKEMLRG